MKRYEEFGKKLFGFRSRLGESITDVSKAIGIDRTHLSKLENGHERPSVDVLNSLIRHYSLSVADASQLASLAGIHQDLIVEFQGRKEEPKMEEKTIPPTGSNLPANNVQINLNGNVPVLYTDSVFVTANQYGIVFDFAQSMGPTNQQNIVSRIGMSLEHAKALLKVLTERLGEDMKAKNSVKN